MLFEMSVWSAFYNSESQPVLTSGCKATLINLFLLLLQLHEILKTKQNTPLKWQ